MLTSDTLMNPKHPVYIISKGRWDSRHTSKALEKMNMPYSIVVEDYEYEQYARFIDKGKILILPKITSRSMTHAPRTKELALVLQEISAGNMH